MNTQPAPSLRRRRAICRPNLLDALEPRYMLSVGDTISTATPLTVTHASEIELSESIGDEASGANDVDMFKIHLAQGQRFLADIDANALDDGTTLSDLLGILTLFDADGNQIGQGDYSTGVDPDTGARSSNVTDLGGDPVLGYTAEADGDYYLAVSGNNYVFDPNIANSGSGNSTGAYLLQMEINQNPILSFDEQPILGQVNVPIPIHPLSAASDPDNDPLHLTPVQNFPPVTSSINDNGTPADLSDDFVEFIASAPGTFFANFGVSDGYERALGAATLQISGAGLASDPIDPTVQALYVGGTDGDDSIRIFRQRIGNKQPIKVFLNGTLQGTFDVTGRIIVTGGSGNDLISVAANVKNPTFIYGGAGNDVISAGSGNDLVSGNDGDDRIAGNYGRDYLIGGNGADRLGGGAGQDLLDAGSEFFDNDGNLVDLASTMTAWTGDESYDQRATEFAQSHVIFSTSDSDIDRLSGGSDLDLFYAEQNSGSPLDLLPDQNPYELVEDIDGNFLAATQQPAPQDVNESPVGGLSSLDVLDAIQSVGDTFATATPVTVSHLSETEIHASIGDEPIGDLDVDIFKVALKSGERLLADIDAQRLDDGISSLSGLSSLLTVFDQDGNILTGSDESFDPDSGYLGDPVVRFVAPSDGDYFIGVSGYPNFDYDPNIAGSGISGYTGEYLLQMEINQAPVVGPDIELALNLSQGTTVDPFAGASDPDGDALKLTSILDIDDNGTADPSDDRLIIPPQTKPGVQSFSYTISDGFERTTGSIALTVSGAALDTDPISPDRTTLRIVGTAGNDVIQIRPHSRFRRNQVDVSLNGKNLGTFSPTGSIICDGLDGDDRIVADGSFAVPLFLYGAEGNDSISGSNGNDVIIGDGNGFSDRCDDKLNGNGGRDLLIGGFGADDLKGDAGDDILLGGNTDFGYEDEFSLSVLSSVMQEWSRTNQIYKWRVLHLLNHDGLNELDLNPTDNGAADHAVIDKLTGGTGDDFFLAGTKDQLVDVHQGEVVQTLDSV